MVLLKFKMEDRDVFVGNPTAEKIWQQFSKANHSMKRFDT